MTRKRLLLSFGFLAALLLAGYVTLRLTAPPRHRITQENIEAIRVGMSEDEVEAILGVPAGNYCSFECFYSYPAFARQEPTDLPGNKKEWVGEDNCIRVRFDDSGRVAAMRYGHVLGRVSEPFLTKLRRWLGM